MLRYWLVFSLLLYTTAYSQYISPVCSINAHQYTIIDIKASVAHSAVLLNGTLMSSLDDCVEMCCGNEWCDLAVFKNNGTSRSNHNCYFVHCGEVENCLLVSHDHFTTVSMQKSTFFILYIHYAYGIRSFTMNFIMQLPAKYNLWKMNGSLVHIKGDIATHTNILQIYSGFVFQGLTKATFNSNTKFFLAKMLAIKLEPSFL